MHVIITRSHSAAPVAAFALRGWQPALALLALAAAFGAAVWFFAGELAGHWARSGHPAIAEAVRERLDENESERRALLREKIRVQNDAVADLQVRLWQLERGGAAIAENLNLPAGLFPPSDSLMTGVGDNIQPILCRGEDDPPPPPPAPPIRLRRSRPRRRPTAKKFRPEIRIRIRSWRRRPTWRIRWRR